MKQTLLLISFWLLFSSAMAQSKTNSDSLGNKLKRSEVAGREQEPDDKSITVYPNPTTGVVNLSLTGFSGKRTTVSVMNVIGTVVYHEVLPNPDARFTKSIDLGKFAHGLYYVKLEADDYSEIRKVVLK